MTPAPTTDNQGGPYRSKKKCSCTQFSQKSPRAHHVLVGGWWLVVVGGGWWLGIGG